MEQKRRRMTTTGVSRGTLKPRSVPPPPPPFAQTMPTQTTPTLVSKGRPPPVPEKPHRTKPRKLQINDACSFFNLNYLIAGSFDEPDYSGPVDEPVLKGSEVVGVKGRVQGQKDRSDLVESIGEALKKQTATAERR